VKFYVAVVTDGSVGTFNAVDEVMFQVDNSNKAFLKPTSVLTSELGSYQLEYLVELLSYSTVKSALSPTRIQFDIIDPCASPTLTVPPAQTDPDPY